MLEAYVYSRGGILLHAILLAKTLSITTNGAVPFAISERQGNPQLGNTMLNEQ